MKNLLFFSLLLLVAMGTQAQDIQTDMTALGNAWKAAYERSDATALAALYAEKVDFVNADGSVTTRTRAEVEANWKQTFAAQSGIIEFMPGMESTALPDGKVSMKGGFIQTVTKKHDGGSTAFKGQFDHHAVKENGQWKLCRMHVWAD